MAGRRRLLEQVGLAEVRFVVRLSLGARLVLVVRLKLVLGLGEVLAKQALDRGLAGEVRIRPAGKLADLGRSAERAVDLEAPVLNGRRDRWRNGRRGHDDPTGTLPFGAACSATAGATGDATAGATGDATEDAAQGVANGWYEGLTVDGIALRSRPLINDQW